MQKHDMLLYRNNYIQHPTSGLRRILKRGCIGLKITKSSIVTKKRIPVAAKGCYPLHLKRACSR